MVAVSLCPSLLAQYTVKRLVFRNKGPYAQQQLEAAAALNPGAHIGTREMGEASQRLMDTGAFDDIEVTLDGAPAAIDVVFKLKPADPDHFLPVFYENLVWLTNEERIAGLKERVPLFSGRVPAAGTLQTQVQQALVAMLAAKGVAATIETEQRSTTIDHPAPSILYRATSPRVVFGAVRLAGIMDPFRETETAMLRKLIAAPYASGSEAELSAQLLQPLRNAGYLDARIDALSLSPAIPADGVVKVNVAGTVVPGEPYRVSAITWAGSDLFSTEDFKKSAKLQAGDLASDQMLRETYGAITHAYLHQGYMDAVITTNPKRDEASHTVSYTLQAVPGAAYRVGSVSTTGLDPATRSAFDAAWKLHPGDVYDAQYAAQFLALRVIPALGNYTAGYGASANAATHTVDVLLTFVPVTR